MSIHIGHQKTAARSDFEPLLPEWLSPHGKQKERLEPHFIDTDQRMQAGCAYDDAAMKPLRPKGKAVDKSARNGLVEALLPVVRSAGAAVLELRDAHLTAHLKQDKSPVTAADLKSEAIIEEGCSRLFPAIPMISEERAAALKLRLSVPPVCFLVDPLDGTKEFIAGRIEFTVNVALIENGTPTAGIIFAPAINRLYFAAGTPTAFMMDEGDRRSSLCDRTVDDRSQPIMLASRSHLDEETAALIAECQPCVLRRLGSSLKFAFIAAGEADLYPRLSPTMVWDSAAGQALVEATGGVVLRANGSPLTYSAGLRNEGFLAARTRPLAEKALAIMDARQLHSSHHRTLRNNTPLGE